MSVVHEAKVQYFRQEKKRALAKDIISDDTSFVKALTREDVEYLFS